MLGGRDIQEAYRSGEAQTPGESAEGFAVSCYIRCHAGSETKCASAKPPFLRHKSTPASQNVLLSTTPSSTTPSSTRPFVCDREDFPVLLDGAVRKTRDAHLPIIFSFFLNDPVFSRRGARESNTLCAHIKKHLSRADAGWHRGGALFLFVNCR